MNIDMAQAAANDVFHGEQEKGAKQHQEDSMCMFSSPDMSVLVAAVFDGHGGLNGRVASTTCTELTLQYFNEVWERCREWDDATWTTELEAHFARLHQTIRERFIEIEKQRDKRSIDRIVDLKGVVRKSSGFPVHGGTTASVVVIVRQGETWKVVCANTGDSDCLLLARKPTRLPTTNFKCKHLSVDHSPDNANEFLRIQNLPESETPLKLMFVYDKADVCRKYECPVVFLPDGTKDPEYVKNPWANDLRPTNVRYDPAVYAVSPAGVSQDITCIAMTRSLGDFYAHQFGLSAIPDVTFETLPMENEYIATIGSDGIWDCWKWDDWSDYVNGVMTKNSGRIAATCRTALHYTVQRAKACFGESAYDDATLILVNLKREFFLTPEEREAEAIAEPRRRGIRSLLPGGRSSRSRSRSPTPTDGDGSDGGKKKSLFGFGSRRGRSG